MRQPVLLQLILFCFVYFIPCHGQESVCRSTNIVQGEFPLLRARFTVQTVANTKLDPWLGGRNQTYCCFKAVEEYLRQNCSNSSVVIVDNRILLDGEQFPCGATWNGNPAGAPLVQASYNWATQNCPGWQLSQANQVTEWGQLLVSFLLPAIVFSFNIPRPQKLKVWKGFFPKDIGSYRFVAGIAGAIGAALCVTIDTVLWLAVSMVFAGPLLLSGLYEAQLDKRVLDYLHENIKYGQLPLALRSRLLFTTLCGNLNMYPAWSDTMDLARNMDVLDNASTYTVTPAADKNPILTANQEETTHSPYDRYKSVSKVVVRLKAMLACQYSFGSTIGGPVVFFLGSFIYALLEIYQDIGDENIAEALAFGMWWTIIPHVAAVAGLLLAGNNPNILEGIVSIRDNPYTVGGSLTGNRLERRTTIDTEAGIRMGLIKPTDVKEKQGYRFVQNVYRAKYTPAWMWDRGKRKQDWLLVLFTDSWLKYERDDVRTGLKRFLTDAVMLSIGDWVFLWFFAFLMLFTPCMFAFLTSFFTPRVGLGCRAMTTLIYMSSQTLLLLLWAYYLTWRDKYWSTAQKLKRIFTSHPTTKSDNPAVLKLISELKLQAEDDTTASEPIPVPGRRQSIVRAFDILARRDAAHPIIKLLFYILCTLGILVSLLTSIGGTLMQIMGVYRNNVCALNIPEWGRRHELFIMVSTNAAADIVPAQRHWIILGSLSAAFLAVVCYVGWWYQKRLRAVFESLAGRLDD